MPKEKSLETLSSFIDENIHNESLVYAATLKLAELIDQNQEFDLMNEHNQKLVGKLMNEFTNNLNIQVSVLKLFEYSLVSIVNENLVNPKNENLKKTLTFIQQLMEKFFYIFLVVYFRYYYW